MLSIKLADFPQFYIDIATSTPNQNPFFDYLWKNKVNLHFQKAGENNCECIGYVHTLPVNECSGQGGYQYPESDSLTQRFYTLDKDVTVKVFLKPSTALPAFIQTVLDIL